MWDSHECEGKLREIITKAVCAKGSKKFVNNHCLRPEPRPEKVLGCWLANHQYQAKSFPNSVVIKGQYELNVWYTYKDNSKTEIYREAVTYTESIPFEENLGRIGKDEAIYVHEKVEPRCLAVTVDGDKIDVEVETGFYAEIVGDTKLCVLTYPKSLLEDSDLDKDEEDSETDNLALDEIEDEALDDFDGDDTEEEGI